MKKSLFLIIGVLVFARCNQNTSGAGAGFKGKANVFSISATSEDFNNPVAYAFDGNPSTKWLPTGDPSGEGVTIRFIKEIDIEDLKINSVSLNAGYYSIYINGSSFGNISGNKATLIDKSKVRTIFIKCLNKSTKGIKEVIINKKAGEKLIYPQQVRAVVNASSSLSPLQSYAPELAFDGRLDFGWVEGSKGQGIGDALQIEFAKKITFDTIYIANGYQRSTTHFDKNSRVKSLGVSTEFENNSYSIKDKSGVQTIKLKKPLSTIDVALIIKSVYPGSKYKDTVISEIKFGYKGKIIDLTTDINNKISHQIKSKLSGSFFNKAIGKTLEFKENESKISLKLRDNGSFVMWYDTENTDYDGSTETTDSKLGVKDGNWVIKSAGSSVIIKIFGRDQQIRIYSEVNYNPYSQSGDNEWKSETTSIFSDTLTINKSGGDFKIKSKLLDGVFEIR